MGVLHSRTSPMQYSVMINTHSILFREAHNDILQIIPTLTPEPKFIVC